MDGAHHTVDHLKDLGLDKFEILSVPCRRPADHVVNTAVIVLTAQTT